MTPPRAVALAGPTASGKTAVALALARQVPVEIISVDSALVYRGMDIGTAKPTPDERREVPHHLIDLIEPTDRYSAARFADEAATLIDGILARGRLPVLVGGTMLYLKALRDGLAEIPGSDPALRATLDAEARMRGWPALHAELMQVDPATAARLNPNDAQRIQRALEVFRGTGRPLSAWQSAPQATPVARGTRDVPVVALEPSSRAWLHDRIAQRFEAMLAAGFVDEVRVLRARGDLHAGLPSMRCVGYRQAWAALEAGDLGPLRETGIAATRQLAKRQLTWLRGWPDRHVVACDAPDAVPRALDALLQRAGA